MQFLLQNNFHFHDHEKVKESLVSLLREVTFDPIKIKTKIYFLTCNLKAKELISTPEEVREEGGSVKQRFAVFEAVRSQDLKFLQYLKANKFDIKVKENGLSLLSYAISLENLELVNYLLDNSFDPFHLDQQGFSDLMRSVS